MRDVRVPVLLAVVGSVCLGGGCQRALLGDGSGTGQLDAGRFPGADAGGIADGKGQTGIDVAVDADGPASDAIVLGPAHGACPATASSPVCPTGPPPPGSECPVSGAVCEYGGSDIWCREKWLCAGDRTWQPLALGCADRCPETTPDHGAPCDVGAWCSYPAQTLCICGTSPGWWACASYPEPGCPDRLPLTGGPCDPGRKSCSYGGCGGYRAFCCGGSWATAPAPCSE